MKIFTSRRVFIILPALAALLVAAFYLPSDTVELRVTPVKGGPPLLVLMLRPGERFTLHYFHSVEMAPIWEEHSVDAEGNIFIEEERYLKFGAGLGRIPGQGRLVRRGPYEVIEDIHRPTGDFILRVAHTPGVNHTIIWRGTRSNLSALAPGKAVLFSARPISLLEKWWRIPCPHEATPTGAPHDKRQHERPRTKT